MKMIYWGSALLPFRHHLTKICSIQYAVKFALLLTLYVLPCGLNFVYAADLSPQLPNGEQRAFPTAEGHGAAAQGGRGGTPLFVTTLNEFGSGSLRACIEADFPRTCIFRVSGTIVLEQKSLVASSPYLTIAGETAPGDGIAIRNGPRQGRPSLEIKANDVIVRHIRLRPGPHEIRSCCSGAIGIYGINTRDVILDHISASWGSDETVDSEHASNITIQWSIFSEPLYNGGPGKQERARNMNLTYGGNLSVHHNLFASGLFRNPQISPALPETTIYLINNVLYSPLWQYVISLATRYGELNANVIGNYKVAGGKLIDDRLVHIFQYEGRKASLYLEGNIDQTYIPNSFLSQRLAISPETQVVMKEKPFPGPQISIDPAFLAFERVLETAGATRPVRDVVDQRIVFEVRNGLGNILENDPNDVGGWPVLKSASYPKDIDNDGMPDKWELENGLDPKNWDDGRMDSNGNGWTNLEEYLHYLAK